MIPMIQLCASRLNGRPRHLLPVRATPLRPHPAVALRMPSFEFRASYFDFLDSTFASWNRLGFARPFLMQGAVELVLVPAVGAHIRLAKIALLDVPVAEIARALAALLARFVETSCSYAAHGLMLHASLPPVYRNIPPKRERVFRVTHPLRQSPAAIWSWAHRHRFTSAPLRLPAIFLCRPFFDRAALSGPDDHRRP